MTDYSGMLSKVPLQFISPPPPSLDFDQLVHACSTACTGPEYQQAFLPILYVRSDRRGGAVIDLQDDDSPEPVTLTITGSDRPAAAPFLREFLTYATSLSDVDPPCLPVIRRGGHWVFDALTAETTCSPEPVEEFHVYPTVTYRPVRFQLTMASSLADSFDYAARRQGMTRQQLLLAIIRGAALSVQV